MSFHQMFCSVFMFRGKIHIWSFSCPGTVDFMSKKAWFQYVKININIVQLMQNVCVSVYFWQASGLEKMHISLQASQNFSRVWPNSPPVWYISLMCFFIFFQSKSQNFPARNFLICLFFPGLDKHYSLYLFCKPNKSVKFPANIYV